MAALLRFGRLKSETPVFGLSGTIPVMSKAEAKRETDIAETLQSLLVAFALALAFRGFVIEGFVIPTGSMAPTLLGQHARTRSAITGYEYAFDGSESLLIRDVGPNGVPRWRYQAVPILDPMISQTRPIDSVSPRTIVGETRMGDRVLVLKFLYEFFDPGRWDVVVFKNPVDPIGPSQNYIKRLVGLAGEQLLLADGDVFVSKHGASTSEMRVVRKPDYIQNAVWQPVYDSDYIPGSEESEKEVRSLGWLGSPFESEEFELDDTRTWRASSGGRLTWQNDRLSIRDFSAYNYLRYPLRGSGRSADFNLRQTAPVSDVLIAVAITTSDPESFGTSLELSALNHRFVYTLRNGKASLSLLDSSGRVKAIQEVEFVPEEAFELSCVNVDQEMSIRINGSRLVELPYEWSPMERLENAYVGFDLRRYTTDAHTLQMRRPEMVWDFSGKDVALRSLRVDRDLYYKPGRLNPLQQAQANGKTIEGPLFATDPRNPAVLGEDQFLMLGDNSGFSRDSRYWGRPHRLVVDTVGDDSPFIAHRDLLIGKAWSVYFPAPGRISSGGPAIIPDFGRVRFIR